MFNYSCVLFHYQIKSNMTNVSYHIAQYTNIISELKQEIERLRKKITEQDRRPHIADVHCKLLASKSLHLWTMRRQGSFRLGTKSTVVLIFDQIWSELVTIVCIFQLPMGNSPRHQYSIEIEKVCAVCEDWVPADQYIYGMVTGYMCLANPSGTMSHDWNLY